jgi:hypothetical protein
MEKYEKMLNFIHGYYGNSVENPGNYLKHFLKKF